MLRYFYEIDRHQVERTSPYAFVVPVAQRDPGAARKMLETLTFGDTEIERSSDRFTAGGKQYPSGSYVIRMQQPFSGWAKTLLERQNYPDLHLYPGGPPKRPYDVTAQPLPLQMGVEVATVEHKFDAPLTPATQFTFELNHPVASGGMAASNVFSWKDVTKVWQSRRPVYRDPATGDFFTFAGDGRKTVAAPRIGLYKSFVPSMDEGWTRWLLEDFGFPYKSLLNAEIQAGGLKQRFDAIVIPDQARQAIVEGHRAGSMPPEYCGGLGEKGAAALKEFVEQGGTLIFFNHASDYATQDLGVKARNVLNGVASKDFYSPGPLLNGG